MKVQKLILLTAQNGGDIIIYGENMENRYDKFTSLILGIYRSIVKIKSNEMSEMGLKGNQVQCIFHLNSCKEGLTLSELCKLCAEDKGAMSRSLNDLIKQGYVKEQEGSKIYKNPYVLTPSGKAIGKKIDSLTTKMVARGSNGINEKDRAEFYKNLEIVNDNLNEVVKSYNDK